MMDLKFRVWGTFNERMMYDVEKFIPSNEYDKIEGDERFNTPFQYYETWQDIDDGIKRPCFVMQYTGLKDKNGKEIYEGDIIKKDYDVWGVVVWKAPSFEVTVSETQSSLYTKEWIEDSEVIGNIYENKELLS